MGVRSRNLDQTHSECDWNLEEILLQVQMLSPSSMEDQKKTSSQKIEGILSPNLIEDQKKKKERKKKSLHRNIRPELGIYSFWQPLFHPIIQTLTLNGESAEISLGKTLKSQWRGNAKSRWGDPFPQQFKYWG